MDQLFHLLVFLLPARLPDLIIQAGMVRSDRVLAKWFTSYFKFKSISIPS